MHPLKAWLKEHKKTQAQAARSFRCRQSTISRFINWRRTPTPSLARRISRVTGIPLETILFPKRRNHRQAEVSP